MVKISDHVVMFWECVKWLVISESQCFDDWVTGSSSDPINPSFHQCQEYVVKQMEEEDPKGNWLTLVHLERRPLNVHSIRGVLYLVAL